MAKNEESGGKDVDNRQMLLDNGEWEEEVSPAVKAAADKYRNALRSHNNAKGKFTSARDNCLAIMAEEGVQKVVVTIDGKKQTLNRDSTDKLTLKVFKDESEVE